MLLRIKSAGIDNIPQLAEMNRQLIIDEGSRNPMTVEQLAERMAGWLAGDWTALLVIVDDEIAGYVLYQERVDNYLPDRKEVYIRQFFIRREQRGKGIGKRAFEMIRNGWLPKNAALTLEVLARNDIAKQFWANVGFEVYSIAMRIEP